MIPAPPIVPSYRALTIVGNVLGHDEHGEVCHTVVVDTTVGEEVEVVYEVR